MKHTLRIAIALSVVASTFVTSSHQAGNAVSPNPAPVCSGATCTVTFAYTGDYYQWSAPAAGTYTLEVWGAQGGGVGANYWGVGGKGGYAKGDLTLSNGANLYIYVGQQGFQSATSGSYNGGGKGNPSSGNGIGFTGGGATHIATTTGLLSTLSSNTSAVKIVAGGGGAAAGSTNPSWTMYAANGGAGGGTTGIAGVSSNNETSARAAGGGGTQSEGGSSASTSSPAGFGKGADANASDLDGIQGGGGGGGWYGGGGGMNTGGGGGGGSGYVTGLSTTTLTAGNTTVPNPAGGTMTGNSGNGVARITYTNSPAVVSVSTAGNARTVAKGETLILTATSDTQGKVTFFADGKKIPGCISTAIPIGTKNCTWKASIQKIVQLKAVVVPTDGAPTGYSSEISVAVVKRTGRR